MFLAKLRSQWISCGGACLVLAVMASLAAADESSAKGKKPIVLVPPFENQSKQREFVLYDLPDGTSPDRPRRQYRIDRFTEAPRTLLEDVLVNTDGISIVERKRVDTLLVEAEFGQMSGLVDPEKATKLGKLLGADKIIIGTITDMSHASKSFGGYGIQTTNVLVTADLRVRVLNIETGEVIYSKVHQGQQTFRSSTFGSMSHSDGYYAAVKDAIAKVGADEKFSAAILGKKADAASGLIEVEFAPKPDNCDVEIDGKYIGGTPLKRKLKPETEYKIRISKAGFKDWTGVITPESGLKITRELESNK